MFGLMPCLFWKALIALQSAADCLPSTGRPRNFSTFFWYGPADVVQLAAWAGCRTDRERERSHQSGDPQGDDTPSSQVPHGPLCLSRGNVRWTAHSAR